jgi:hypothetical protein
MYKRSSRSKNKDKHNRKLIGGHADIGSMTIGQIFENNEYQKGELFQQFSKYIFEIWKSHFLNGTIYVFEEEDMTEVELKKKKKKRKYEERVAIVENSEKYINNDDEECWFNDEEFLTNGDHDMRLEKFNLENAKVNNILFSLVCYFDHVMKLIYDSNLEYYKNAL